MSIVKGVKFLKDEEDITVWIIVFEDEYLALQKKYMGLQEYQSVAHAISELQGDDLVYVQIDRVYGNSVDRIGIPIGGAPPEFQHYTNIGVSVDLMVLGDEHKDAYQRAVCIINEHYNQIGINKVYIRPVTQFNEDTLAEVVIVRPIDPYSSVVYNVCCRFGYGIIPYPI